MKTSELTGAALDWAVCEAAGLFAAYPNVKKTFVKLHTKGTKKYIYPSTDWAQGGPIIERERIALGYDFAFDLWQGYMQGPDIAAYGPTPLIAAMRCYVASVLGDDIELPEGL